MGWREFGGGGGGGRMRVGEGGVGGKGGGAQMPWCRICNGSTNVVQEIRSS